MPVYEYLCPPCDTRFERYVQRFGDPVECPECHETQQVERQLSTFAMAGSSSGPGASPGGCCGGGCGCRR